MPRIEWIRRFLFFHLCSTKFKNKWNLHSLPPYAFMANVGTILPLLLHILKLQVLRGKEKISVQIYFNHLKHNGNHT